VRDATDARGLRIAYVSDIAGIGVDREIDGICRRTTQDLTGLGAKVEEISFDASDGRAPYQTWRGAWMVGQRYDLLERRGEFGPNLKGNIESGLKVTSRDLAAAEAARAALYQRFCDLFERYDLLLTPAAPVRPYPVEQNFPREINGRTFDNYVEWIAPAFLITLMSLPAGSVPAGKTADGLPVGLQIVGPRFEEPSILAVARLIQTAHPIGWPPYA
jgi:amidase